MASTSDDLFGRSTPATPMRVRALLTEQPWLAAERDDEGVSPLLRARYRMDRAMIEAVRPHVERLNVFEAATFGDLDRLTELLAEDPELVDAVSGDGFTPLHLAAFFGQADAVRLLLARGAQVDAQRHGMDDRDGAASPVQPAGTRTSSGCSSAPAPTRTTGSDTGTRRCTRPPPTATLESVELLLDAGADPAAANDDGETALILAEKQDDLVIVERLREAVG